MSGGRLVVNRVIGRAFCALGGSQSRRSCRTCVNRADDVIGLIRCSARTRHRTPRESRGKGSLPSTSGKALGNCPLRPQGSLLCSTQPAHRSALHSPRRERGGNEGLQPDPRHQQPRRDPRGGATEWERTGLGAQTVDRPAIQQQIEAGKHARAPREANPPRFVGRRHTNSSPTSGSDMNATRRA